MAIAPQALESLLQSMNIIAEKSLHEVSFDKTIVCTIVDNSNAEKQSYYTVTDGSVRFDAYDIQGNKIYKVNEQVYVKIPNGDFTDKKIIDGYYISDKNNLPVTYVSPLDTFLDMSTLTQLGISEGLIANSNTLEIPIWNIDLTKSEYDDLQQNGIYDTIGLQGHFKCLLDSYQIKSGAYGLRLDMYVRLNPNSSRHIIKSVYLDSSEMFGNPYSFTVYSAQAQTYDISSLGIIDGMTLYFYQDNNFEYFDGDNYVRVPTALSPNIFVKDIYVAFGSEVSKVTDNTIKLYTNDSLIYNFEDPTDLTNSKTLGFLWYNKSDDQKYLGFSDGIVDIDENGNIIPYDELEYLNETKSESSLLAQMGKDVPKDTNGLEVAANWEEGEKVLDTIETLLRGELVSVLTGFYERVNGISIGSTNMDTYFKDTSSGKITLAESFLVNLESYHEQLKEYFSDALSAAAAIQKHQKNKTEPTEDKTVDSQNIYSTNIKDSFLNEIISQFYSFFYDGEREFLFKDLKDSISKNFQSFQNAYDIWSNRVNIVINKIEKEFVTLDKYLNGLEDRITSTTTNEEDYQYILSKEISTYLEKDLSVYDNRYCAYWYKYNPKYIDEEDVLGNGWERLIPEIEISDYSSSKFTMPYNLGLPLTYTTNDEGISYFDQKPKSGEGLLQIYLDPNRKEEKFKVVLFYNHQMFESNVITFTNVDNIPDYSSIDKGDAINIKHEKNSFDSYQTFYSHTNTLLNKAEEKKNRELSVHYDGILGKDELLLNAKVFWYVPRNSTMLTVDAEKLRDDYGFTSDYFRSAKIKTKCQSRRGPGESYNTVSTYNEGRILTNVYDYNSGYYSLTESCSIGGNRAEWIAAENLEFIEDTAIHMDGYFCFYKEIGSVKKDFIDENGDTILDENGDVVQVDTVDPDDLLFAYKIKNYYTSSASKNTIFCKVQFGEEYLFETSKTMFFGQQGTSGTDYTLIMQPLGVQNAIMNGNPLELSLKAFDYNNVEIPILNTNTNSNLEKGALYNPRLSWKGFSQYNYNIETANNYNSGSNNKINNCEVYISSTPTHYCGILQLKVNLYDTTYGGVKELNTYYPVPYSSDKYYIEGATTIIYDSNGGNPSYYKDPYKIFNGSTNEELTNVVWRIRNYLDNNGIYFVVNKNTRGVREVVDTNADDFYRSDIYDFYQDYVPVLNSDNTISPSILYISDETGNDLPFYPVVECLQNGQVIWAQPILIYQNRYPNSMINHWDGKFKIDAENGIILSTMVAAGYKNSDNTFSGVMMGDIQAGSTSSENKDGLGIYGFNHGAQSFGLNIDGTAFFGKAGRGRILIDGNRGTISSASYQQNKSLEKTSTPGMLIDLDDGIIDIVGARKVDNSDDTYTGDNTRSRIQLNSIAPYFFINSAQGHRLINIGDNTKFNSANYIPSADEEPLNGKGYYLKTDDFIASKLTLKHDALIENINNYGKGTLFDLSSGNIEAYNFSLKGESSDKYPGSFIKLSSDPSSFIDIYLLDENYLDQDNEGIHVLEIGTNSYKLHSFDWMPTGDFRSGMEIDLNGGCITGYTDTQKYGGTSIKLDAEASIYPFEIGNDTNENQPFRPFRIAWDGSLSINGDAFTVDAQGNVSITRGQISLGNKAFVVDSFGNLKINTDKFVVDKDGNLSINDGAFTVDNQGNLNINGDAFAVDKDGNVSISCGSINLGDKFIVDNEGYLTATSGKIGGWNIGTSTLSGGNMTLSSSGSISSTNFNVSTTGILTATGATLTNLTVKNNLNVHGSVISTNNAQFEGSASFGGNTTIGGTLDITGDTTIKGSLTINTPNFIIGTAQAWSAIEPDVIRVDVPYGKGYDITIHNGIITHIAPVTDSQLIMWLKQTFKGFLKGDNDDKEVYITQAAANNLQSQINTLKDKPHLSSSDVNALIKQYLKNNGFVTRSYIHQNGMVTEKSDGTHVFTLY